MNRGAKRIQILSNRIQGIRDGAGISVLGADKEDAQDILVSGNIIENSGVPRWTRSGAIRVYRTNGIIIKNNIIAKPNVYGINLMYNVKNSEIVDNHIADPYDEIYEPACVMIWGDNINAVIGRNTFVHRDRQLGVNVSSFSISYNGRSKSNLIKIDNNFVSSFDSKKLLINRNPVVEVRGRN